MGGCSMNKNYKMKKRQGSTMLMVLFLLLLLTLFASSLYGLSLMNVKESIIFHEQNQAYLIAKAGAETIIDQYALLDNTQLNTIFEDVPLGADPETSVQKGNPYTVTGEIAGGRFEAIITKNGRQILIESTGHHKRGKGLALVQLIDVNRYGIAYVKNGDVTIRSNGNATGPKMVADIAHYPAMADGETFSINGGAELNGSTYTHSPATIQSNNQTISMGSLYTDNSVMLRAGTDASPGRLTFDGVYTSYPTYVNIFDGALNDPVPGTIIGNEIKRGDNSIGNYPRNVKIRVSKNIITFRYTNTFGYPDGFPMIPSGYAVFGDSGDTPAEPMPALPVATTMTTVTYDEESGNTPYTLNTYSSSNWPSNGRINHRKRRVRINLNNGESLALNDLTASDLRVTGNGTLTIADIDLKKRTFGGDLIVENGATLIVSDGDISTSSLQITSSTDTPSKYQQNAGTLKIDGNLSMTKSEMVSEVPVYLSGNISMTDSNIDLKSDLESSGTANFTEMNGNIDGDLKVVGNIQIQGSSDAINGNIDAEDTLELDGDLFTNGTLTIRGARFLYHGDVNVNRVSTTTDVVTINHSYLDHLGNDETKGSFAARGGIKIDDATFNSRYMKSTSSLDVEGDSTAIIANDLVAPVINVENQSKLVNYNRIFANTEFNVGLDTAFDPNPKDIEIEGKNLYVQNFLSDEGARLHFEEIRNINDSGADVVIGGTTRLNVNDIIARSVEFSDTSYTKALAVSVVDDFILEDGAELDMKIYEDLTDVNSKNSYSNIVWMDKD
jgi:cytoskeletal protein CcmA (bactofilin family)